MKAGPTCRRDVLKAEHHGSRWSTTESFLDRVHPSLVVLSCGANNVYNHPHQEVLDRLSARGIRAFRTDRQGAITVETDGLTLQAHTMR